MKYLMIPLITFFVINACSPKQMENNTHEEAPIYEAQPNIQPKKIDSIEAVEQLYAQSRPIVEAGEQESLLMVLDRMEDYLLNKENLANPVIHTRGNLHPTYQKLMNLYGLGMTKAIKKYPRDKRLSQLLNNYRATIFSSCNLENTDCQNTAAFKGPYNVNILSHLIRVDIKRIKDNIAQQRPGQQAIKNVIFSLYILQNFNERLSTLTQSLFIDFSSVFFRSVDLDAVDDPLLSKYLLDLQNMMVRQASQEANPESCSIFQELSRNQLAKITSSLNHNFVVQFNNHYYRCHSPEQIVERIIADEVDSKKQAEKEVQEQGPWPFVRNDIHSRQYIMKNQHQSILNNFNVSQDISVPVLHLMDQLYYGRLDIAEQEALLSRLSQQHLQEFVSRVEQYAQLNFLYNMQYTFNTFDKALNERFEANQTINKKFVQEVYDQLWESTGDMWLDYRRRMTRLRQALSDIYFKIDPEKREQLTATFEDLKDNKLEDTSVVNMINVAVTYPIVMATNYFTGVDGGGTIELRVSWARGAGNTIEISTVKPLKHYFLALTRNLLQLLDFGTTDYQPREFERNYGFAVALKTGFFDTVNFDLGKKNQGLEQNLKLFWSRYVEHNREFAEIAQREIEELRKIEENHWPKTTRICENPITGSRRIDLSALYQNFYLNSKEGGSSISTKDLQYATRINSIQHYIERLNAEIQRMRRTYQVVLRALEEMGHPTENLRKDFQAELIPHFSTQKSLIEKRQSLVDQIMTKEESCLYTLNRMERFQQNIMQKNAVLYLARVHAAMTYNTPESDVFQQIDSTSTAEDIKNVFKSLTASSPYQTWVIEQMTQSTVLEKVEEQLRKKGKDLLSESLNLILSPHNLDADFGIVVRGLKTRAKDLSDPDSFLVRRGGFDSEYFIISNQDQRLRVREELFDLSAKASEIRDYFASSPRVLEELKNLGYDIDSAPSVDKDIDLNPNLTIFINNYQYFKDQLGKTEKRARVQYQSNQKLFVQEGLEKLFGNNQEGQQIFNWSSAYSQTLYVEEVYGKNIETYKNGPIFVPFSLDAENPKLSCALDPGFDRTEGQSDCLSLKIEASQIVDEFVQRSEFFYLDEAELSPMVTNYGNGELDPLSDLLEQTLLNSDYIDHYKPSSILSYFKYYKKKTEPEAWTWFDQFLAKKFTTVQARDGQMQMVNVPMLPGTSAYERVFEEVKNLEFDNLLIPFNDTTEKVFRNYYRANIVNSIKFTDQIISEMRAREYTQSTEQFPKISFKREDVADLEATNGREWIQLDIDQRNNGSLILLQDYSYEVKVYEDQQKLVLEEFECSLLPRPGDYDYSSAADQWIKKARNCEGQVARWMQYKKCEQVKEKKQEFPNYHLNCASGLEDL